MAHVILLWQFWQFLVSLQSWAAVLRWSEVVWVCVLCGFIPRGLFYQAVHLVPLAQKDLVHRLYQSLQGFLFHPGGGEGRGHGVSKTHSSQNNVSVCMCVYIFLLYLKAFLTRMHHTFSFVIVKPHSAVQKYYISVYFISLFHRGHVGNKLYQS